MRISECLCIQKVLVSKLRWRWAGLSGHEYILSFIDLDPDTCPFSHVNHYDHCTSVRGRSETDVVHLSTSERPERSGRIKLLNKSVKKSVQSQ